MIAVGILDSSCLALVGGFAESGCVVAPHVLNRGGTGWSAPRPQHFSKPRRADRTILGRPALVEYAKVDAKWQTCRRRIELIAMSAACRRGDEARAAGGIIKPAFFVPSNDDARSRTAVIPP
jgi:hypothetical protein